MKFLNKSVQRSLPMGFKMMEIKFTNKRRLLNTNDTFYKTLNGFVNVFI